MKRMTFFLEIAIFTLYSMNYKKKMHRIVLWCKNDVEKKTAFFTCFFSSLFTWCHEKLKVPPLKTTTKTIIHNEITISCSNWLIQPMLLSTEIDLSFLPLPSVQRLEIRINHRRYGCSMSTTSKRTIGLTLPVHKHCCTMGTEYKIAVTHLR